MNEDIQLRTNACRVARKLLGSNEAYLENVIELWKIGTSIYGEGWDTEFHIFGVIKSDTDHIPLESVRQKYSEKMLEKSDNELKEVIAFYKKDVFKSCNKVLLKHGVV